MSSEHLRGRSTRPRRAVRRRPAEPAELHRALLAWYRRRRRDLPWRRTRDPYLIWVSEIMLQQTQVATVLPFYQKFIERFPSLEQLAHASGDDVLTAWAGLGYYRRARHLHDAARRVVREHAGRIPDDPERFRRLSGVGPYTAGAVLSIAFDRPLPVLDGNVARVLSRVDAMRASMRDGRGARRLWARAAALVPMRQPGDWNQALMELGATVCLPRAPLCEICPVAGMCRARQQRRVTAYPPRVARRRPRVVRRALVLIERGGRVLMARRKKKLLEGLWEPPGVELDGQPMAQSAVRARLRTVLSDLGVSARLTPTRREVRHVLTHRDFRSEVWRGTLLRPPAPSGQLRWVNPVHPNVPVTGLVRRIGRAGGVDPSGE